jgi:hypothetical protein
VKAVQTETRDAHRGLVPLTTIARWQPVHEIALHLIDLVGADLGKALIQRLCPEAVPRMSASSPPPPWFGEVGTPSESWSKLA